MSWRQRVLLGCLLALALFCVTATYHRLSQTADEHFHAVCGQEWWEKGTYTTHRMNPPLPRIMAAALVHFMAPRDILPKDASPLERYEYRTLFMRLGVLPFFPLSCLAVFALARRFYGNAQALCASAIYAFSPTVLAHAGFATTDMAYTATFLWAFFAFLLWLERPSWKYALLLGIGSGFMLCAKFSSLLHFPLAAFLVTLAQAIAYDMQPERRQLLTKAHASTLVAVALPVFLLVVGLIYRFRYEDIVIGLHELRQFNDYGFAIWFFGPVTNEGVWYYFPAMLLFKAPIAFHILWCGALAVAIQRLRRSGAEHVQLLFPFLAALAVLVPGMFAHINIGVRHVLPVFALLALPAGSMWWQLWQAGRARHAFAVVLVLWMVSAPVASYPEYVAYYNELGGAHPEHISVDSDFDWGQNIRLLGEKAKQMQLTELQVCAKPMKAGERNIQFYLGGIARPCPKQPQPGWVALSRERATTEADRFGWITRHIPVAQVGKTMDIYFIEQ
jgi:hypothetical protein